MKQLSLILIVFMSAFAYAQEINQMDANGQRHGVWRKNFDKTNEPRYEGTFEHGKEVGTFKFYKLVEKKSVLSATKEFNANNDEVLVTFFTSKGKVISKGKMRGNLFIGDWVYYHENSGKIMSTEHYNEQGQLTGEKLVYYKNGQIAERAVYVNGKIDGVSRWFNENGMVVKEFVYKMGELHGLSKFYNEEGQLLAEGHYRNDQKHGIWKYYENGVLTEEKDFTVYSKNPIKQ